jgi:N-acetylmuramoyl-L-alanine amidase
VIDHPDSPLVDALHPSPNFGPRRGAGRADMLLLHYTGLASCTRAIEWLARPDSKVSCHYVVDEAGRITQMVAEAERAWHAGRAVWAGEHDINSASVGVEIHNPGHDLGYPDFPAAQLAAVEALSRDIVARRSIPPERVLAHSDVAPARKKDPGEKFPWGQLARAGIGHWVPPEPVWAVDPGEPPNASGPAIAKVQQGLRRYGYGVITSGVCDAATELVIAAFQRHFRPERVDGRIDRSTAATLERLLAALAAPAQPGGAPFL